MNFQKAWNQTYWSSGPGSKRDKLIQAPEQFKFSFWPFIWSFIDIDILCWLPHS